MKRAHHILPIFLIVLTMSCQKKFGHDKITQYHQQIAIDSAVVERYLEEEIDRDPEVAENYIKLFGLKKNAGKTVEASSLITTAVEKLPNNDKVLSAYALWKLDTNDPQGALKILEKAKLSGESAPGLLKLYALANLALNDYDRSLDYVNKALAVDKNDWELHYIKADNYLHLHDSVEAMNHFRDAFHLHPVDSTFNKVFGIALAQGDKKLAGQYLEQFYRLRPDAKIILLKSATFFRTENRLDTSNFLLRKYLHFYPNASAGMTELTKNFYQLGQYDSVMYYADKIISGRLGMKEARLLKAKVLDKRYRYNDAKEELEALIKLDSTNTEVLNELDKVNKKIAYLRDVKRIEEQRKEIDSLKPIKKIEPLSQQ